jgi:hypothetical protein
MPLRPRASVLAVLVAGLAATLVAGCADGLYQRTLIPPTDPQAQECLGRCERLRENCRERQVYRERECEARFSAARADYDLCTAKGAGKCAAPEKCLGADTSICAQEHQDCFAACGGRVEKRFDPWRKSEPPEPPATSPSTTPAAPTTTPTVPTASLRASPPQPAAAGGAAKSARS